MQIDFEFGTFYVAQVFNMPLCAFSRDLQTVMATWARLKALTTAIGVYLPWFLLGRLPLAIPMTLLDMEQHPPLLG